MNYKGTSRRHYGLLGLSDARSLETSIPPHPHPYFPPHRPAPVPPVQLLLILHDSKTHFLREPFQIP